MATIPTSGIVDVQQPGANMYGCLPCPKCGAVFRYPHFDYAQGVGRIRCDDCGYMEPWIDQAVGP